MPPREWRFRIADMLHAIRLTRQYVEGMDFDEFLHNQMVIDAVLYRIAVIGEAASAVPIEVQRRHTSVPWTAIRGMRNRLVHEYFGIRLETVWETACTDLPALAVLLERLLTEVSE